MRRTFGAAAVVCLASGTAAHAQVSFRGLGHLEGTLPTFVAGISPDGSVTVGMAMATNPDGGTSNKPVAWRESIELLQGDPPYWDGSAYAASIGGEVVVGWGQIGNGSGPVSQRAFRATSAGVTHLAALSPDDWTYALNVTPDGGTIVGRSGPTPCVWNGDEPPAALPMPDGATLATAMSVSADGGRIAGTFRRGADELGAVLWTGATVTEVPLPPDPLFGLSVDLSLDGTTLVGSMARRGGPPAGFRWTESEGFMELPNSYNAHAVSGDGSIIGGIAILGGFQAAALWIDGETVRVSDLLASLGVDLTGWTLAEVNAVSADGMTIAGRGTYRPEPGMVIHKTWIAVIPGPSAALVVGAGLVCARRRRTH